MKRGAEERLRESFYFLFSAFLIRFFAFRASTHSHCEPLFLSHQANIIKTTRRVHVSFNNNYIYKEDNREVYDYMIYIINCYCLHAKCLLVLYIHKRVHARNPEKRNNMYMHNLIASVTRNGSR